MTFKKLLFITFIFLLTQVKVYSAEKSYLFGGAKIFNYGIESSDLQSLNSSLVALGFSSSTSSTDNTGIGFAIGYGSEITPNFFLEGSYVNYGTLKIETRLTGPTENLTTEITGDGIAGAIKYVEEGFYVKAGLHSWDFTGTVTASLGSSTDAIGSGTDPFFGIGFDYDQWELGYEHYQIDDGDISSFTFTYSVKF